MECFFMELVVINLEALEPRSQVKDLLLIELGSPTPHDFDQRVALLVQDVA